MKRFLVLALLAIACAKKPAAPHPRPAFRPTEARMSGAEWAPLRVSPHPPDPNAYLAATTRNPNDANAWNDLAAVYSANAAITRNPSTLPNALAAVEHALQLDPKHAAARFNRALILEQLGFAPHASEAWREYLKIDATSGWAAEARKHSGLVSSERRKPDKLRARPTSDKRRAASPGGPPTTEIMHT